MKPKWNRLLAAVLCTCILLAPAGARAVEIDPEIQAQFDHLISVGAGDILDQFLGGLPEDVRNALIAAEEAKYAAPTVDTGAEADPASGSCGIGLGWELDGSGTLTITGTGEMFDFRETRPAPWYDSRESITALVLEEGVTTIGSRAFADCVNLKELILPQKLGTIGDEAFQNCTALEQVQLPGSLEAIGWGAFSGCEGLTWIQMPGTIKYLGGKAWNK